MKKNSIFLFPKEIYSENEVLPLYKKYFPNIVDEYKEIVKKTYLNAGVYNKEANFRAEKLKISLGNLNERFAKNNNDLSSLLHLAEDLHRDYAFYLWLISYAINEGPASTYYVEEIDRILRKVYKNEKQFFHAHDLLIRTDYEIFYHMILTDSVKLRDLLVGIPGLKSLTSKITKKQSRKEEVYDQIVEYLKSNKKEKNVQNTLSLLNLYFKNAEFHGNMKPVYNLFDEAFFSYRENLIKVKELPRVKKAIDKVLIDATKRLSNDESNKLRELYLLIRSMLEASDSTFGIIHLDLYPFWDLLIDRIVVLVEKKLRRKLTESEKDWTFIPWGIRELLV